jgi:hypothetical protein
MAATIKAQLTHHAGRNQVRRQVGALYLGNRHESSSLSVWRDAEASVPKVSVTSWRAVLLGTRPPCQHTV